MKPVCRTVMAAFLVWASGACQTEMASVENAPQAETETVSDAQLREQADRLAREFILVDTHIDVPYRLGDGMEDLSQRTARGDFDHPRARAGGLDAAFMAVYVPASRQESGGARKFADHLIDLVEGFSTRWPEQFAPAASIEDIERNYEAGRISLPMGMENGAGIEADLRNLEHFYRRGIRYITLTHSKNNLICDSSYDREKRWSGLSPFGESVVAEMNRLGMMIDVSHVSDETFFDVMKLSRAPVIASHSSCRHFTPGWERNMSDEMIRELARQGGVIHINFGSSFINDRFRLASDAVQKKIREHLKSRGLNENEPQGKELARKMYSESGLPYADVSEVADHIDHVVRLVGIEYVGLGSDFDGVGDSLPTGLKDVSQYPNLLFELLKRGYSEDDIHRICSQNLFRVWRAVEQVARES